MTEQAVNPFKVHIYWCKCS